MAMEGGGAQEDEAKEQVELVEQGGEGGRDADAECEEKEEEEEEKEEKEEENEEHEIVELDGDEEQQDQHQEEEHKQEESEDDEVQFVCSVEGSNGHHNEEKEEKHGEEEEDADVVVLESGESTGQIANGERSTANMNALMAANGFVTPATLEAELQCIICQYAMFKPVTAICGHSFCRVCLMDSFLTRSIEEAQCPICRVEILQPFVANASLASMFPINVTLWNLVQLLIPSVAERISSYEQEEEEDFTRKLDQLDTKWKVFNLDEQAARYHGDHDEDDANSSGRWEEDHEGHDEYPVLKVEDSEDGNLHVSRNIVLDTNDENEDGYVNMRVGMAIVEFPSVFELYNEHQECSVNVIKMEEDEEMADGMPFFMNEDGDDDGFVCGSYYNEITLRVCDEGGNCVMERTRGARGGVVIFPGLRLDVPGGVYTFRFSDDLYGLKLSITTHLREPHEISDTPVADYVSLINDEARNANRRNHRHHHDSDNEDDYDEENESDDSFIVDDINGAAHNEEPVGRFSDDEESHWDYYSDDEAADEEREQRRVRRQRRSGRRAERDVQFVEENQEEDGLSDEEGEQGHDETEHADEHEEDDHEEEEVQRGRRNVRVVEEAAFSSDEEGEQDGHDAEDDGYKEEEEHNESHEVVRPRRRNANHILDSEDDDEGAQDEDEQKEDDVSDGGEGEHDENDGENEEDDDEHGAAIKEEEGEDDEAIARNRSRKMSRAQWFQEDESDEGNPPTSDVASSREREDEVPERPRKRARGRDRQVRVIDEGESDEEQEQIERSIVAANSLHGHDHEENADEDGGNDSQFRRVHQFYDEETDERHAYEDAQQDEEDAPDYPDEEEEQYQEEDYYSE